MPKYLNDEQQNQLIGMLNGQNPTEPSPEGEQPPVEDTPAGAPVDAGAPAPAPQPDPNAAALAELGVSSIEELVERYKEREGKANEYKDMLAQLLAYQQALNNESETL